jgi:long-chain fatty acid transport protein
MKYPTKVTLIGSAIACGAVLPQSSQAGGIQLYEIATPDVGLASAGYAARAQDASTVFKNPAGMSLLQSSQFQGGLQLTYGSVEFSPNSSTTVSGGNGGNAIGALPAGSLFFTHALSDRFAVGLGAFSYFGLALEYDDNWGGATTLRKTP